MAPIRAILFDVGGTLDGPGAHWESRFEALYRREGVAVAPPELAAAFGHSTRSAYADAAMCRRSLAETVRFHVQRQAEFLGLSDAAASERIAARFLEDSRAALAASQSLLARLRPQVRLGVISNFYGNVALVLDEAGITPLLDVIIDSTCVGCSKPDPQIFRLALAGVGTEPSETVYVGDSFEKDIRPAHQLGLRTAWLVGSAEPRCPDPSAVDFTLRRLEDIERVLSPASREQIA